MEIPDTRYAWNGDISLAYQTLGDGSIDLIYLQGYLSNVELNWEHPAIARFLRDLARAGRLIITDRRGLGCSERFTPADTPPMEVLMDDVLAVLDAAGSRRPVLFATGDCGPIASLFAATYPDRVAGLVLYSTFATERRSDEIWWGETDEEIERSNRAIRDALGDGSWTRRVASSLFGDDPSNRWPARYERLSLTPGSVYWEGKRFAETDIRGILPSIHVPTRVLHRTNDTYGSIESGRYLASHIPHAALVELPGDDHFPWSGDHEAVLREVRLFLDTLREEEAELDRALATIVFTDIVDSTARAAELGDRRWGELRAQHDRLVRAQLARFRGREVQTTGDGFLATFDGPARAVRCVSVIVDDARRLGIEVRSGVHTGEVQLEGADVRGIAVHIGARLSAMAGPGEVLVSQTVKDLVAGSGLVFEDAGEHELKGVPDRWRLYRVVG